VIGGHNVIGMIFSSLVDTVDSQRGYSSTSNRELSSAFSFLFL